MTATSPVQAGRRYRRIVYAILGIAIVSLFAGMLVGQSLAGLVVYAVGVVVGFGLMAFVWYSDSLALQDEREAELGRRASGITFQLFGYLGLFAFVAIFLLDATGHRSMGRTEETLLYAYSIVTLTWGVVYTVVKYRR